MISICVKYFQRVHYDQRLQQELEQEQEQEQEQSVY
jgi:hypothetical protein